MTSLGLQLSHFLPKFDNDKVNDAWASLVILEKLIRFCGSWVFKMRGREVRWGQSPPLEEENEGDCVPLGKFSIYISGRDCEGEKIDLFQVRGRGLWAQKEKVWLAYGREEMGWWHQVLISIYISKCSFSLFTWTVRGRINLSVFSCILTLPLSLHD